jgi:NIPSNAP
MITCYLKYIIDPYKVKEFEAYAKLWIPLVIKFGGTHHGYFLPHEGANNIAYALFSFSSLADYEKYRSKIKNDDACIKAFEHASNTRCIVSFERSFMKPIFQQE